VPQTGSQTVSDPVSETVCDPVSETVCDTVCGTRGSRGKAVPHDDLAASDDNRRHQNSG